MDICFSNNAANTNTQQSPPLANFWLKKIETNYIKQRDTNLPFLHITWTHTYEETASTYSLKRYLRYTSSNHHKQPWRRKQLFKEYFQKKNIQWEEAITVSLKRFSNVHTNKEYLTGSSIIAWTKQTWREIKHTLNRILVKREKQVLLTSDTSSSGLENVSQKKQEKEK